MLRLPCAFDCDARPPLRSCVVLRHPSDGAGTGLPIWWDKRVLLPKDRPAAAAAARKRPADAAEAEEERQIEERAKRLREGASGAAGLD